MLELNVNAWLELARQVGKGAQVQRSECEKELDPFWDLKEGRLGAVHRAGGRVAGKEGGLVRNVAVR